MKINYNYIHEFDIVDDFNEYSMGILESTQHDIDEYYNNIRTSELKSFFENSSSDTFMEAEKEGILTKIGNAVISLVKKIRECISKFLDKFLHKNKKIESDVDIVNRMIIQHPEIRDVVVDGIKKEWFTYRDIAQYEHDIVQLMIMLENQQISNKKFKEKAGEKLNKFIDGGQKIIATGATIAGVLLVVPKIMSAVKKSKKAGKELSDMMDKSSKKSGTARESVSSNDETDTYITRQQAILEEGAKAYSIINKYNNLQLSNLERLVSSTKNSAKESLKQENDEGDK